MAAPTLITATPPVSLARRSCSFSLSKSEVEASTSAFMLAMRCFMASAWPRPSTIVVLSLLETTFRAFPKSSIVALSSFNPTSSLITRPPVKTAISCNMAFLRSPKPGALTANALKVPRSLLTTKVAKASPSISSAIITIFFLPACARASSKGRISWMLEIFLSVIKISAFS